MRALNSTASKTIAKVNSGKPSQRKNQSPATEAQPYDQPATHAHGSRLALNVNPSSTARPRRPSSRQSALSSFSATSSSGNLSSTFKRLPSSEALRAKASRPTIITATVAKPSRAAPISGANRNQNNKLTTASHPPTSQAKQPSSVTSRLSRSPHAARLPLNSRNQNAAQMTQKASSMSRNVKVTMPPDRSTNPTAAGRPTLPHLSASATRSSNRPPLTPKIAASKPTQAPSLAANAGNLSVRRTNARSTNGSTVSARSTPQPPDDDQASFLGHNITPRSGKRQSRVDSANSTPNGTPDPGRLDAWDRDLRVAYPSSPGGHHGEAARRPVVAFSPGPAEPRMPAKHELHVDLDSKFFHASDIKSNQSAQPKPTIAKSSNFLYASGLSAHSAESKPSTGGLYTSAPSATSSQNDLSSKFIYANGTPDLKPGPSTGSSRPGSVISVNSKAAPNRAPTSAPSGGLSNSQRSISPPKNGQQPYVAQLKSPNMPTATTRGQGTLPPQLGPAPTLRRTSTGTSLSSHSRNGSAVMGEADLKGSFISSGPPSPLPLASPSQPPLTLASIIQAAEDFGEDESVGSHDDSHSEVQSPTKSTHSGDPVNDLVANARRERKVQDLQITNASLEAINRTLERQLRKQTSELRRFRRMSRAGRLSTLSGAESSRAVSDSVSGVVEDVDGLPLSDLDEEVSDELEGEEDEEPFSDTDSASESVSPSLMATRDARYGRKDEQQLQRDLSKHKELLIDSQKINQSIKRCLDWTEELIKEGKKALEYSIRPSDVVVPGPRVLNPADEEEHTQASINFDQDAPFEDAHNETDDEAIEPERIMPLEPRLAGWKPDSEAQGSVAT
ncbi:hypothetical protein PFICI_13336 [Pestalotiopsis fici W106-1]|uniref:Uncharacterized protein n=1 Tax=Pestalotiopsis fici (strain W106-1 / CGMCC3.15140) TaxID=1229662 RepID=W3WP01_PESFW|nr:uncharacterized protein PFICI_13336 [Pestalotiopsis fici W106-1]ETS74852.1 hypothetical protein PFICI_13336 [Pestalotiopsis fici W106-1]